MNLFSFSILKDSAIIRYSDIIIPIEVFGKEIISEIAAFKIACKIFGSLLIDQSFLKNLLINLLISSSFSKTAIIEEFITGREISVEYISFEGKHYFLNT